MRRLLCILRSAMSQLATRILRHKREENTYFLRRSWGTSLVNLGTSLGKKRRRDSISSVDSYSSGDGRSGVRDSRERANSRSTRRKFNHVSPPSRGRRTESRSPHRERRPLSNDRQRAYGRVKDRTRFSNGGPSPRGELQENRPSREKSLSPFSKRLALTQAMNMRR